MQKPMADPNTTGLDGLSAAALGVRDRLAGTLADAHAAVAANRAHYDRIRANWGCPARTTDPRIASLPEWLRLQGRTTPEMDPAEFEWCAMMNAAALEIERSRARETARLIRREP